MTGLTGWPGIRGQGPRWLCLSFSAPPRPAQAHRFRDRFGLDVLNSYGQTELGGEVVGWTAADIREYGATKLGALGRPHPGIVIRILTGDRRELPAGEVGQVWLRSPFAIP